MKHYTDEEINKLVGEKWCPMVRRENVSPSLHELAPIKDGNKVSYSTNCIGTKCMMLRYIVKLDLEDSTPLEETAKVAGFYCGLAGKP